MKNKKKFVKEDFTYKNLPHNRFDVFKRLLTKRFVDITKVGLIACGFFGLFLICNIGFNLVFRSVLSIRENEDFLSQLFSVTIIRSLCSIFLIMLGFLGIGCLIHFLNKMVWDEITFLNDYFEPLKRNWWKFLLIGLFVGVSYAIFIFIFNFTFQIVTNKLIAFISLILGFTQFIFIISVAFQYLMLNEIYKMSFRQRILNTLKFSIINLAPNMGFAFFAVFPLCLIFVNLLSFDIIATIFFPFLLSPSLICNILFINKQLDKYINLENYPEIYEKGIYRNY